jgi:diadenosine tetraphosphate (Ap4A) HIT family hydrolase
MTDFLLHPRLAADSLPVADLPLCRVLLMNDARFPWLVLVPRLAGAREIMDLPPADRLMLAEEADLAAAALRAHCAPDKLNIAAIGNVVEQLHLHVVARYRSDPAWPGVVWGFGTTVVYEPSAAERRAAEIKRLFTTAIS